MNRLNQRILALVGNAIMFHILLGAPVAAAGTGPPPLIFTLRAGPIGCFLRRWIIGAYRHLRIGGFGPEINETLKSRDPICYRRG